LMLVMSDVGPFYSLNERCFGMPVLVTSGTVLPDGRKEEDWTAAVPRTVGMGELGTCPLEVHFGFVF
jgi:hypothetical protein